MAQTKRRPSGLLTTEGSTPLLPPAAVNRTAALGQHSTPSAKTEPIHTSIPRSSGTLSNLTENEKENALLTVGVFASTLPALLNYRMVRKAKNKTTGEVLLVFPSTLWTDDLRLKDG